MFGITSSKKKYLAYPLEAYKLPELPQQLKTMVRDGASMQRVAALPGYCRRLATPSCRSFNAGQSVILHRVFVVLTAECGNVERLRTQKIWVPLNFSRSDPFRDLIDEMIDDHSRAQ